MLIAGGDEAAFSRFFYGTKDRVYAYLLKLLQSPELAEDGVQELYFKLWRQRERLQQVTNFDAYWHRMVRNYAYSCFRTMAVREKAIGEIREIPATTDPEAQLISKELDLQLRALLDGLSPQQRSVFVLSRQGGMKHEEIAREMGISVLTVKKHMTLALRVLRDKITLEYLILVLLLLSY